MGIIQRQALRNTIISFAGAFVGGTVRILMPIFIPVTAQVGLINLLDSISGSFVTFLNLGYNQVLIKLFPRYRNDENGHHGFLMLGILLSVIGTALSFIVFYFFGDMLANSESDMDLFRRFAFLIFPMIFFRIIYYNIDGYAKMLYNTFIGTFLDTFLSKVFLAIILVFYVYAMISFDVFVYLYAATFCIPGLLVTAFAFVKTKRIVMPAPELRAKDERKKIYEYILFGILLGATGSIIVYIDQFMIAGMLSFEKVAIYTILFTAARFIMIPSTAIIRIAQVVISEAWERNDRKAIFEVYQKSCINLLLISAFLLGLGWTIINPVFALHPKYADYAPYTYIYLILGSGIVVEMATGVNLAIIASSKHYRYNMYFSLAQAAALVILNLVLIPQYQLLGVAFASFSVMALSNLMRWYLLYRVYNLQPFDLNFFKALVFCTGFILLCFFADYDANPWVKIAINLVVLTAFFWTVVIAMRFSVDINQWLKKMKSTYF